MTYDFQAPLGEVGQVFETPFMKDVLSIRC